MLEEIDVSVMKIATLIMQVAKTEDRKRGSLCVWCVEMREAENDDQGFLKQRF
jgi:hypothetical protein